MGNLYAGKKLSLYFLIFNTPAWYKVPSHKVEGCHTMRPHGCIFLSILLLSNLLLQGQSDYKNIKAVTSKWTSSTSKEYQLKNVPDDQFQAYSSMQITSDEACAIRCLKDAENKCASFKVEIENGILTCKLGPMVDISSSEVKDGLIFVDIAGEFNIAGECIACLLGNWKGGD